jgi:hypothetical protein
VKHISVSPLATPKVKGNLSDLPVRNSASRPRAVAFCKRSSDTWVDVANDEFLADVRAVAKGPDGLGDRPGRTSRDHEQDALRVGPG